MVIASLSAVKSFGRYLPSLVFFGVVAAGYAHASPIGAPNCDSRELCVWFQNGDDGAATGGGSSGGNSGNGGNTNASIDSNEWTPPTASQFQDAELSISLPGFWSYTSTVPGGRGLEVLGGEYTFFDTTTSPPAYVIGGETFNRVTDHKGNEHFYFAVFKSGYEASPRVYATYYVGGGDQKLQYDDRANLRLRQFTEAFGDEIIVLETGYEETCSNIVTCNKPSFKKDALGHQTDYTYDPIHGGILTETGPAVDGVRPQTRYTYATYQARYKNASGSVVASGQDIYLLTSEAYCISTNADPSGTGCVGGATDEVVTTYDYGPTTGANNLWLRGTTVTADGQSLTTCNQYDDFGNMIAQTAPKSDITSCY